MTKTQDIHHLYSRAGFGLHPQYWQSREALSAGQLVEQLFEDNKKFTSLQRFEDIRERKEDVGGLKILKMILKSRKDLQELNLSWLDHMSSTSAQLREKMTFFWHNHFATQVPFPVLMQAQNNMLRTHALGNFKTLLEQIAMDPAMIIYLNNQQNKKNAPNENFARELMELFTMGRGNYTEQDIKESARAFTGWHVGKDGYFKFEEKQHDDGQKTFFGQTGNWNGQDIIRIILEQPSTAVFISKKLYRYFIHPTIDQAFVNEMAQVFRMNNYEISPVLKFIFTSKHFYRNDKKGSLIKSPVELIVSYKRLFGLRLNKPENMIKLQRGLGQLLFFPPNVAGWPGNQAWIDSTSLLLRMNLPYIFLGRDNFDLKEKELPESALIKNKEKKPFLGTLQFDPLQKCIPANVQSREEQYQYVFGILMSHTELVAPPYQERWTKFSDVVTAILSLPEYQLH